MLRRSAVGLLLGACAPAGAAPADLDPYLDSSNAAAVLVDVPARRRIGSGGGALAWRSLQPPGSSVKPFVLAALLESGRLKPKERFPCPARLRLRNRSFDCVHPALGEPVDIELALAYSCNCFVAHVAERFQPGELARELGRFGLGSASGIFEGEPGGRIRPAVDLDDQRIQALGEDSIAVTAAGLAMAYRSLAGRIAEPLLRPILKGLEGAVDFGTAQNAGVAGVRVAGKTGSALSASGEPVAWFAGFAPSADPKAALAVMLPGRSGGADAAPLARRIFEAYFTRKL